MSDNVVTNGDVKPSTIDDSQPTESSVGVTHKLEDNSDERVVKKVKFDGENITEQQTELKSKDKPEHSQKSEEQTNEESEHNHNHTHQTSAPAPHHHHYHSHVPHHHHHFDPESNKGPIPHIHSGDHIHFVGNREGEKNEKTEDGDKAAKGSETNEKEAETNDKETETNDKDNETNDEIQVEKTNSFSKQDILEVIRTIFPHRRHLGALVYNPTTTWLTLQTSQLTGLKDEHFTKFEELRESYREKLKDEYYSSAIKYIPVIPPLPTDYINYLLEVKIPYRFVKTFLKELYKGNISKKRELWGGVDGVYTDDSDILTVLAHSGFFDNTIDLSPWNKGWTKDDIIIPSINKDNEIKGDLSVTILLLPGLKSYESIYSNGINSRSWKEVNRHDGLSFAIFNIKWEIEGSYLRDKSFFKRYQTELSYDEKYMKQMLESKDGWTFDVALYKELKKKFETNEKTSST